MRLNQITAGCKDLAQSIAFYQLLGLRLIVRSDAYARFELPAGEATFSLHVVDGEIPRENAPQLYFECDDVDFEVQRLKIAGVAIERAPVMQSWQWYEAWLRDPAGNQVCIFHAGNVRRYPPWRIDAPPGAENLHLVIREGSQWAIVKSDDAEAWRTFQARYSDFKTSLGPFEVFALLAMLEREWPEVFLQHQQTIRAFAAEEALELLF